VTARKVTVIGALLIAVTLLLAAMPEIHDPTEEARTASVVNDHRHPVAIGVCEDQHCHDLAGGMRTVQPGEAFLQDAQPHSHTPFLVVDRPGDPTACVVLVVRAVVHPRYELSSLNPCS
jgi:hypothetical protein